MRFRASDAIWAHRLSIAAGVFAVALFTLTVGVTQVQAGAELILSVDVDEASFVGPGAGTQGPSNIEGDVEGGGPGTYQCWGWMYEDGTTNVSQVYNIEDRGAIMTQGGPEGFPLAIVGGTGDFINVRGEALQEFIDDTSFIITFDLTGAGGPSF